MDPEIVSGLTQASETEGLSEVMGTNETKFQQRFLNKEKKIDVGKGRRTKSSL